MNPPVTPNQPTSSTNGDPPSPPRIERRRAPNYLFQRADDPDPNSVLNPPSDDLDPPTARRLSF